MPKYIANAILHHEGHTYRHGQELTMTEAKAEMLGKKVVPLKVAAPDKPLKAMTLKELKPLAKVAGIENYSKLDKQELLSVLEAVAPEVVDVSEPEPAVEDHADEQTSG